MTDINSAMRLADDSFKSANYVQAYSYYSIVLQSDYNNYKAHFFKGLSSAYTSTLANLKITELTNEFQIAVDVLNKSNISASTKVDEILSMMSMILTFCIDLHNLASNHRTKFSNLMNANLEYYSFCEIIIKLLTTNSKFINEGVVKLSPYKVKNYIERLDKNLSVICDNASLNYSYNNGNSKVSPPNSTSSAVNMARTQLSTLQSFKKWIDSGMTLTYLNFCQEELHKQRVTLKENANKNFRSSLIIEIIFYIIAFCMIKFAKTSLYGSAETAMNVFAIIIIIIDALYTISSFKTRKHNLSYDVENRRYTDQ